ncbi:DUF6422 family protein [Streptomyces sp. SS]|uniref:DUF6422 family protein n=1 Tax=Streptomyces sp. SS TaxID=260742 RepID=UPI0003034098|nr:DUF6422 family protein [Streptomyces sp. SS]
MSEDPEQYQRSDEQAKALARAMRLVIDAQREAAEILRQAGAELEPEEREWFSGGRCMGSHPPPPTPHFCLCPYYLGNGNEPCRNTYGDARGPDDGNGPPTVRCRHPKSTHGFF